MSSHKMRCAASSLLVSVILLSLTLQAGGPALASPAIQWDDLPTYEVETTQGSFFLTLNIQLARDQTDLHFRVSFEYPVVPQDPELVYFAVEFDLSGRGRPMAAGNEMIIVSRKLPSGLPMDHFSYIIEQTERNPVPTPSDVVTLDSFVIEGSRYTIDFHRPLQTADTTSHYQFIDNSSVLADFAVGEWGMGRGHSYTSMVYLVTVTETGTTLTKPTAPGFEIKLSKGSANLLGQIALVATFTLIGVHIFRRRIWDPKNYQPWLAGSSSVEVERHSLTARATHIAHVGLFVTFVATGWSMLTNLPILGNWTLTVHMAAAFVTVVNIPLHFTALYMAGEWKQLVRITRDDIAMTVRLALNFVGLSKEYPEHVTYSGDGNGYYLGRKYCSYQKLLLWGDTLFFLAMALTGFALYYPGNLDWLQALFGGRDATLAFHDLFFYLLTSTVTGHLYFSLIPANWPRLSSIVRGKARVPVHRE